MYKLTDTDVAYTTLNKLLAVFKYNILSLIQQLVATAQTVIQSEVKANCGLKYADICYYGSRVGL